MYINYYGHTDEYHWCQDKVTSHFHVNAG